MLPWTKALWFNIQAEGQGSPRQVIMYRQYPFSEQKQQEAKVKVKETDPTHSQIWVFPVTLLLFFSGFMAIFFLFLGCGICSYIFLLEKVTKGGSGNLLITLSLEWMFTDPQHFSTKIKPKTDQNQLLLFLFPECITLILNITKFGNKRQMQTKSSLEDLRFK